MAAIQSVIGVTPEEKTVIAQTEGVNTGDQDATTVPISSAVVTATDTKSAIEEVFTYANDGKTLIATAITNKGVSSSPTDTFSTLATNIGNISGSSTLTGNATAGEVLSGKEFYSNDPNSKLTGTMVDKSGTNTTITPSNVIQNIPTGYYDGTATAGKIAAVVNLTSANIKHNAVVGGVTGTYDTEASVPITAATVLSGKKGRVNGATITGTMVNRTGTGVTITPYTADQAIPIGFYDGNATAGKVLAVANATPSNIVNGVTIAGVYGTAIPVFSADGSGFTIVNGTTYGTYTLTGLTFVPDEITVNVVVYTNAAQTTFYTYDFHCVLYSNDAWVRTLYNGTAYTYNSGGVAYSTTPSTTYVTKTSDGFTLQLAKGSYGYYGSWIARKYS